MKKVIILSLLAGGSFCALSQNIQAKDLGESHWSKERFQIRARVIGVLPNDGGSTTIGGKPDPNNVVVPELDISYFFTENIAVELILATSKHNLSLKDSDLGTLDLGDTWILPPTLTLQYHFAPDSQFSPYVGVGVNYTLPYSESAHDVASVDADGSFGYAVQAGADYWLDDHWGLNFDVKKIWVDVNASINGGAITGDVDLNPWVVGAGVSYRF